MEHFLDNVIQSDIDMDGYVVQFEKMLDEDNGFCSINQAIVQGFRFSPLNRGCKDFDDFRRKTGIHVIVWTAKLQNMNITKVEFVYYLEYLLNVLQISMYAMPPYSENCSNNEIYRVLYRVIDEIGYEIIPTEQGYYLVQKNTKIEVAISITKNVYDLDSALYLYTHSSYKDNLVKKADILCRIYKYLESLRTQINQYGHGEMYRDISKLMDALDIRHSPNKKSSEAIENMSKEDLIEWYDRLFEMCISLIILVDYSSKRKDIKELKNILG